MSNYIKPTRTDLRKWRTEIPNLVFDIGLSPYEIALYSHIVRVAGRNGGCWKSTKTLAKDTGMSTGMVVKTKKSLKMWGLIQIRFDPHTSGTDYISVVNIWEMNFFNYADHSYREQAIHHMNDGDSPHEPKNIPFKNKPYKNKENKTEKITKELQKTTNKIVEGAKAKGKKVDKVTKEELELAAYGVGVDKPYIPDWLAADLQTGKNYKIWKAWCEIALTPRPSGKLKKGDTWWVDELRDLINDGYTEEHFLGAKQELIEKPEDHQYVSGPKSIENRLKKQVVAKPKPQKRRKIKIVNPITGEIEDATT